MNRFGQLLSVSVVAVAFSACGGGGGSSPAPSGSNTTPSGSNTTQSGSMMAFSNEAGGEARIEDGKYLYTFQGKEIDVTLTGISSNNPVSMTVGDDKYLVGGTQYSYSRFGAIGKTTTEGIEEETAEVFYIGKMTASMPTTGSATYRGHMIGVSRDLEYEMVIFDVDYGAKKISGYATKYEDFKFEETSINGAKFDGKLYNEQTGIGGEYSGVFFGSNAQELGGIGQINIIPGCDEPDCSVVPYNFSFGAKK